MAPIIQIGPWIGEFGWEIMNFVPAVRAIARGCKRVVVGCQEGREALYADFATEYRTIPHVLESCEARGEAKGTGKIESEFRRKGKWIRPKRLGSRKEYIRYGHRSPEKSYDLIIHARHTPKVKFGKSSLQRNWAPKKWDRVVAALGRISIAAIGLKGEALCPEGVTDLRNADLKTVMDVLASSRMIAGPQSGPIHLSALCGCPAVVWTRRDIGPGKHKNERRLKSLWNPFGTPVKILDGFDIDAAPVIEAIQEKVECSVLADYSK